MGKADDLDQASKSRGFAIFSTPRGDGDWFKDWMRVSGPDAQQRHWRRGRRIRAEVAMRVRLIKKAWRALEKGETIGGLV